MSDAGGLRVIEQVTRIAASPETVWRFWTEPERLSQWWGASAEIEPEPGGRFRVVMADGPVMIGEFVEVEPPHRLSFSFGWDGNPPGALSPGSSLVEVELTASDGDTVVTLRHSNVPATHVEDHTRGWAYFIGERLGAAVTAA